MSTETKRPYRVEYVGGSVPTQATGWTEDERPFYFRARHGAWTVEVGDAGWPLDYAKWPDSYDRPPVAEGDDESGGWMEKDEALRILDRVFGKGSFVVTISELLLEDDRARPRSLQTEIGMSEVGGCRRRAGYRLNRIEPTDEGGSMPAILGTLLHEGIESRVRKKHPTALLEVEVEFAGILGHVDMYLDGVVTDFKTTSSRFLETIKRDGPPRSHVWQVNGYAAGLTKLKWEVRRVRLVYIARDTGEEWTWDATFHPKPIADALEWVANVRDTPLEMLPRDYQPDSPFCQSCPFRTLCWDGGVTGRDPLSVLYVDDPDAAKWAEELHAARLDKKDAEEREERAKGALDALRPNDTGTATVDVGYRLPLVWQVRKGRRTVDVDELERQGVEVPYKTGSPSVVLAFGAPLEASSD